MSDKVCAVVGYGPGVGHGVARAFAAESYDLALLSGAPERHAALRAELELHRQSPAHFETELQLR